MNGSSLPRGVVPPIPTFLDGGRLDERSQRELVQSLRIAGIDGILTLGTAGEGPTLTDEIRAAAIEVAVEVGGGIPVVVGCSGQTADSVVRQIEAAAALGATTALVLPPFYFTLSQASIIRYLTNVSDRSSIPVMLYHIPGVTGNPFGIPAVEELSVHPRIVGIKDSAGDFIRFLQIQRTLDSDDFVVFQGVAALVGPSLLAGCSNSMCTVTALLPEPEMALRRAIAAADLDEVRVLMHQISAVTELFRLGSYPLPANFKAIAAMLGIGSGRPHDPAVSPDPEHLAALREGVARLGLLPGGDPG